MPEVVYPTMVAWPVAVHSVRRGLSYYNAQCFLHYSLHGGNCSRRHTAVQGFLANLEEVLFELGVCDSIVSGIS